MDERRRETLQRVVFERLTLGRSREVLREDLREKLDEAETEAVLDEAVRQIVVRRAAGDYSAYARTLRTREFGRQYRRYRIIGSVLLALAALIMLVRLAVRGQLLISVIPLMLGLFILLGVEAEIRKRTAAAARAVNRLMDPAA